MIIRVFIDHKSFVFSQRSTTQNGASPQGHVEDDGTPIFLQVHVRGWDNDAADAWSHVGLLLSVDALSVCQSQWMQEVANFLPDKL